jgi:hypothetical protein
MFYLVVSEGTAQVVDQAELSALIETGYEQDDPEYVTVIESYADETVAMGQLASALESV